MNHFQSYVVVGLVTSLAGCGGSTELPRSTEVHREERASVAAPAIGEPCTPAMENDVRFRGFSPLEVNIESAHEISGAPVCLVDHFRGRVSCPEGGSGCLTPRGEAVVGEVSPQCLGRSPDRAVYTSCRCANAHGRTDDGDDYCTCPESFDCRHLVASVGTGEHLSGSYCTKPNTTFDAMSCVTR